MTDLSRPWPFGLDEPRWWLAAGAALGLLILVILVDYRLLAWAQGWSPEVVEWLRGVTRYGESGWILIPSAMLFGVIWLLSLLVRWKLMRLMLVEQAWLFAFILCAVGLPSLVAALLQRLIGRGQPMQLDELSVLRFRPNLSDWEFQSLPSAHATTAFALAMAFGFLSARWFWAAIGFAVVIGVSRVATGMNYPSDVLAGAALGISGAYLVRYVFSRRGMMFRAGSDGAIRPRKTVAMWRYLDLRRQRSVPKPRPDRT